MDKERIRFYVTKILLEPNLNFDLVEKYVSQAVKEAEQTLEFNWPKSDTSSAGS